MLRGPCEGQDTPGPHRALPVSRGATPASLRRDGAPRRVAWRLKLARYGDDAPGGYQSAMEARADATGDVRAVTDAAAEAVADGQSSAGVRAAAEGAA